ncbi:hypothetical protein Gohar_021576, partial [Gossypium harknessii]|nr:hypothetical protein [Gossypium harknessii]
MALLDKKAMEDFITPLWNSWNNMNNFIFRGKVEEARVKWDRALTLSNDFRLHNINNKPISPFNPVCQNWKKPNNGMIKINVDSTVSNGRMGFRVVAGDDEGFVVGGSGGYKETAMNSEWAELMVLKRVRLARKLKFLKVVFESDNVSIVNKIRRN